MAPVPSLRSEGLKVERMNLPSELPIVQAPMAGGPSTPSLTAAVSNAGAYGFLAGGYLSLEELRAAIVTTRNLTGASFGVNLFMPSAPGDPSEIAGYAATLQPEADRLGVALGQPRWEDDLYGSKLELLEFERVHLVSFTFGSPTAAVVDRLHRADIRVAVTVTSEEEALLAVDAGTDLLVVQGGEAGGHQASFLDLAANHRLLLTVLAELREAIHVPMIATGGIMTGRDAGAALSAGAIGVQLGTALLCTPEAGTSSLYRRALLEAPFPHTILTRAYSGRFARGLANRFGIEHDDQAPVAYPEVHHLTRPLRVAATVAGDASVPNLWAGTGWRQLVAEPAARVVQRIVVDLRRASP